MCAPGQHEPGPPRGSVLLWVLSTCWAAVPWELLSGVSTAGGWWPWDGGWPCLQLNVCSSALISVSFQVLFDKILPLEMSCWARFWDDSFIAIP